MKKSVALNAIKTGDIGSLLEYYISKGANGKKTKKQE
jgi:hypothetical protein